MFFGEIINYILRYYSCILIIIIFVQNYLIIYEELSFGFNNSGFAASLFVK